MDAEPERLAQEIPEPDPYELAESETARGELDRFVSLEDSDAETEARMEAGAERAGRLIESDEEPPD